MFRVCYTVFSVLILCAFAQAKANENQDTKDSFRRSDHIVFPTSAPYSPQVAALGKKLFFDPRLSGAQNMSCATCHNPSFGWETPKALAIGALNEPLERHSPTVENLAEATFLFWDGRASSLERQAIGPITHPKEMNASMEDVIERLSAIPGYKTWFTQLFPNKGVTEATILQAIATFERTLRSSWAPFDDWLEGDAGAISPDARAGFELFVGKAQCGNCHTGWAFTDHAFHDIGLLTTDKGRGLLQPDAQKMQFAFKTSSLRNIEIRAPYMHQGSLKSLEEVIIHYVSGGIERPSRSHLIKQVSLSLTEQEQIIAFLETLTAYDGHVAAPALPPGGSE